MERLKPCPFCGGEAEIVSLLYVPYSIFYVKCKECEISQNPYFEKQDAIAAWNRREEAEKALEGMNNG